MRLFLALFTAALITGCAHGGGKASAVAVAQVSEVDGSGVSGTVTFTKTRDGVRVDAKFEGLTPGKHGFHIHEKGDCSDSAKAAGGHFNAVGAEHGSPGSSSHNGDLGNLVADKDGKAQLTITSTLLSFHGEHSILGRGVIVHAGEDDLQSQPSGAAGARVACGTIQSN